MFGSVISQFNPPHKTSPSSSLEASLPGLSLVSLTSPEPGAGARSLRFPATHLFHIFRSPTDSCGNRRHASSCRHWIPVNYLNPVSFNFCLTASHPSVYSCLNSSTWIHSEHSPAQKIVNATLVPPYHFQTLIPGSQEPPSPAFPLYLSGFQPPPTPLGLLTSSLHAAALCVIQGLKHTQRSKVHWLITSVLCNTLGFGY